MARGTHVREKSRGHGRRLYALLAARSATFAFAPAMIQIHRCLRPISSMHNYRLATTSDASQLAQLRWDFRLEEHPGATRNDHATFISACTKFIQHGIDATSWAIWVAEENASILSHIYVQRIDKVPKPNRLHDYYGYVTNVYTCPQHRGHGIGSTLMQHMLKWAKEQDFENLIVWPSETSVNWYKRAGFVDDVEALTFEIRQYVL
jgi:GNAT superfamily N-acetyltransferase